MKELLSAVLAIVLGGCTTIKSWTTEDCSVTVEKAIESRKGN